MLRELAGIGIHASQVERAAEVLDDEIAADEQLQTGPLAEEPLPPTLYLGLDGTGIPMRAEELEGRAGKQPDGSAKTPEVTICAVRSVEGRDSKGLPMRDEGSPAGAAFIGANRKCTAPSFARRKPSSSGALLSIGKDILARVGEGREQGRTGPIGKECKLRTRTPRCRQRRPGVAISVGSAWASSWIRHR